KSDWSSDVCSSDLIKTVLAESYERIHRSNLVMMGVLPLQFVKGENAEKLGLSGKETFTVNIDQSVRPNETVTVTAVDEEGNEKTFDAIARFDSDVEIDYYRNGGILRMVLRDKLAQQE